MSAPVVTSETPDAAYLRAALARAGRAGDGGIVSTERLTSGRVNASITRLCTATTSYVWKPIARDGWSAVSIGAGRGEAELWLEGATRELPAPLACPTLDVASHDERNEWWILMEDVSAGIWPPVHFDVERIRELLVGLARLHARWWGRSDDLARLPIPSLDASTGSIGRPTLSVLGGAADQPWVEEAVRKLWVVRELAPVFLDTLDPIDADFYLQVCRDRGAWVSTLEALPPTLIHADLRRANLAFLPDRISVFDWERATRGPAGLDLQWFWFLRFWAYPPPGGPHPIERWDPLLAHYLDALDAALGRPVDRDEWRVGWEVGWIAVLSQIAWCLIDPLTSPEHTAEDLARVRRVCRDAIALARRARDAHVR